MLQARSGWQIGTVHSLQKLSAKIAKGRHEAPFRIPCSRQGAAARVPGCECVCCLRGIASLRMQASPAEHIPKFPPKGNKTLSGRNKAAVSKNLPFVSNRKPNRALMFQHKRCQLGFEVLWSNLVRD